MIHIPITLLTKTNIDYKIILLALADTRFAICIKSNVPMTYDLIGNYTYYDTPERRHLALDRHTIILNKYIHIHCESGDTYQFSTQGYLSGLFFVTNRIPSNIKIIIDTHIYWDYDKSMIKYISQLIHSETSDEQLKEIHSGLSSHGCDEFICKNIIKKLNCDIYWIPVHAHMKWDNPKHEYMLNLNRIDSISLLVTGCNCDVYFLTHDLYDIQYGRCTKISH